MRMLVMLVACCVAVTGCATTGATDLNSAAGSALSVARSGVDALANSFDAALYGLDFAMDAKLLTPGSTQAKQIAAVGRQVQHYLNVADSALKAGNSAEAKAAIDQANTLISQFKALLPAKRTGLVVPLLTPQERLAKLRQLAA
jgi:hypothetical protein